MKKFLVVIAVFLVLICSKNVENDFTLLDYFSGEYTSYTEETENEESLNLGFCYMQNVDVDKNKLVGESLKIYNFEPIDALKKLNATLVKTQIIATTIAIILNFFIYETLINNLFFRRDYIIILLLINMLHDHSVIHF